MHSQAACGADSHFCKGAYLDEGIFKNIRNKKYAFRTWLNSIGMKGQDYEQARRIMLSRLPGRSDRRSL